MGRQSYEKAINLRNLFFHIYFVSESTHLTNSHAASSSRPGVPRAVLAMRLASDPDTQYQTSPECTISTETPAAFCQVRRCHLQEIDITKQKKHNPRPFNKNNNCKRKNLRATVRECFNCGHQFVSFSFAISLEAHNYRCTCNLQEQPRAQT